MTSGKGIPYTTQDIETVSVTFTNTAREGVLTDGGSNSSMKEKNMWYYYQLLQGREGNWKDEEDKKYVRKIRGKRKVTNEVSGVGLKKGRLGGNESQRWDRV